MFQKLAHIKLVGTCFIQSIASKYRVLLPLLKPLSDLQLETRALPSFFLCWRNIVQHMFCIRKGLERSSKDRGDFMLFMKLYIMYGGYFILDESKSIFSSQLSFSVRCEVSVFLAVLISTTCQSFLDRSQSSTCQSSFSSKHTRDVAHGGIFHSLLSFQ